MSSEIIRAMTQDGSARVLVVNARDMVETMRGYHRTSPTATAALGRLLAATSMLGSLMAEKNESLTIGIQGDGPAGKLLCVSDYYGNVRGYIENPEADVPNRTDGKLNVGGLVGEGILYVIRDNGVGEPQTGMIQLKSGEIAEDIAAYYAESEQLPTLCALGVLVDTDYSCRAAGGVLVQLLPFPEDETVCKLEENSKNLHNLSSMFDSGKTVSEILDIVLDGIPYDAYDTIDVDYTCTCSRDRMKAGLMSLGKREIETMLNEQEAEGKARELTTVCRFCNTSYTFDERELADMFKKEE